MTILDVTLKTLAWHELKALHEAGWKWKGITLYQKIVKNTDRMLLRKDGYPDRPIRLIKPM